MAGIKKVESLKTLLDAYGIGVRAGVLTPCLEDENEFRALLGLKPASASVVADWGTTEGVRKPITIQSGTSPQSMDRQKPTAPLEEEARSEGT